MTFKDILQEELLKQDMKIIQDLLDTVEDPMFVLEMIKHSEFPY